MRRKPRSSRLPSGSVEQALNGAMSLDILPILLYHRLWSDVRVVEGAALEMLYSGNAIVGSNPTRSVPRPIPC